MDAADLALRNLTYRTLFERGRAPRRGEIAALAQRSDAEVLAAWQRLQDAHALVLDDAGEIRMANPFSAVPTVYRVMATQREWFANCAWDAFGVCAALHSDGEINTQCADCGEPLRIQVRHQQPNRADLLFHCLVPAAQWWDDIVFT